MPTQTLLKRTEVAWNYNLLEGDHNITLKAGIYLAIIT